LRKTFADAEQKLDATYFELDDAKLAIIQKPNEKKRSSDEPDGSSGDSEAEQLQTIKVPQEVVDVSGRKLELATWPPTSFRPRNTLFIEWIYIFDLEAEEYLVSGHGVNCAFALSKVDPAFFGRPPSEESKEDENPGEEETSVEDDQPPKSKLFLPADTEADVLARLGLPSASAEPREKLFGESHFEHDLPRGVVTAVMLAETMYKIWITSPKVISIMERHVSIHDKAFREACYALLCLVLGNSHRITMSTLHTIRDGLVDCKSTAGRLDELTTTLGSPWYAPGRSGWICPETLIFKIGNIHVLPYPGIEYGHVAEAALDHMVYFATEQNLKTCFFGIILSLRSVILVKIDGEGLKVIGSMPFATHSLIGLPEEISRLPDVPEDEIDTAAWFELAAFQERAELER
jgi:hypothetical protein